MQTSPIVTHQVINLITFYSFWIIHHQSASYPKAKLLLFKFLYNEKKNKYKYRSLKRNITRFKETQSCRWHMPATAERWKAHGDAPGRETCKTPTARTAQLLPPAACNNIKMWYCRTPLSHKVLFFFFFFRFFSHSKVKPTSLRTTWRKQPGRSGACSGVHGHRSLRSGYPRHWVIYSNTSYHKDILFSWSTKYIVS